MKQLSVAASTGASFPAHAKLSLLGDPNQGPTDAASNTGLSYFRGVPDLVLRVKTKQTNWKTYKCGLYSNSYTVHGAVTFNGGGNPAYSTTLESVLAGEIGISLH